MSRGCKIQTARMIQNDADSDTDRRDDGLILLRIDGRFPLSAIVPVGMQQLCGCLVVSGAWWLLLLLLLCGSTGGRYHQTVGVVQHFFSSFFSLLANLFSS